MSYTHLKLHGYSILSFVKMNVVIFSLFVRSIAPQFISLKSEISSGHTSVILSANDSH